MNLNKKGLILILRAVPGSGKTTLAEAIKSLSVDDVVICCADDYFHLNEEGTYQFDSNKLNLAHSYCKQTFDEALQHSKPFIIVANTNTKTKDFKYYEKMGNKNGYLVSTVIVENRHGGVDVHGVPQEVKDNMSENILNSIKLK